MRGGLAAHEAALEQMQTLHEYFSERGMAATPRMKTTSKATKQMRLGRWYAEDESDALF